MVRLAQCKDCEIITGSRSQEFLLRVPTADHTGGVPMLDLFMGGPSVPNVPKIWSFYSELEFMTTPV